MLQANASRSFTRVNTLPPELLTSDKCMPPSADFNLERSKTERRPNNILAEEAAQIYDDKISIKDKVYDPSTIWFTYLLSDFC